MSELPKADKVLDQVTVTKMIDGSTSQNLTQDYLCKFAREYARQLLDYVAENVKLKLIKIPCERCGGTGFRKTEFTTTVTPVCPNCNLGTYTEIIEVDKESILKFKDQLQ